jgi:hypothetical protein
MADEGCCKLVGNLSLGIEGCITSISTSCNTELNFSCGIPLEGMSTVTVNISALHTYEGGTFSIWKDCSTKAGVSIPYVTKYDCENDIVYFIFSGQGQSFGFGSYSSLVTLKNALATTCTALSASSSSGPSALYTMETQTNGYGMTYNGGPIAFDTSAAGTQISLGGIFQDITMYLQNFSIDAQLGQYPMVSYTLVYAN